MKLPQTVIELSAVAAALFGLAALASQNIVKDPKYLRVVDLARCDLKVVEVENVDQLQLDSKTILTPSGKDARLILIHLIGSSPEVGRLPFHAPSFGVHYLREGAIASSPAKAVGLRGKTAEGQPYEAWFHKPENMTSSIIQSPGDEVSFWLAVEIPRDVKEFIVRIPTLIAEPVQVATM